MSAPAEADPAGATRLRPAVTGEADLVRSIVRETFLDLYRHRHHPVPGPTTVEFAPLIEAGQVWMIEAATGSGAEPVGIMVLKRHPAYLLMDIVAILPAHQHRGHGRAALAFAEAHAATLGLPELRFYTNTTIERNVAFYRRLGYIETGQWQHPKRPNEIYVDLVKSVRTDGGRPETALDRKPPRAT